jgi:superoxide dismutase
MEIHHQKHHGAYVASLNMAEEKYEEAKEKTWIDMTLQII